MGLFKDALQHVGETPPFRRRPLSIHIERLLEGGCWRPLSVSIEPPTERERGVQRNDGTLSPAAVGWSREPTSWKRSSVARSVLKDSGSREDSCS